MKIFESTTYLPGGFRLTAAILTAAALAMPVTASAEVLAGSPQEPASTETQSSSSPGYSYSYMEEFEVEQTCEEWEKVRRCASSTGEVKYECVSRGPLSKFWAKLRSRPQDDEVEVIRKAPESTAVTSNGTSEAGAQERASSADGAYKKKIVKKGTLPPCQDNQ